MSSKKAMAGNLNPLGGERRKGAWFGSHSSDRKKNPSSAPFIGFQEFKIALEPLHSGEPY